MKAFIASGYRCGEPDESLDIIAPDEHEADKIAEAAGLTLPISFENMVVTLSQNLREKTHGRH